MTEKIQWVYDNLEDNKSKMIFQNRKNYVESGEEKYIEDIVRIGLPEYTHNIYYSEKSQKKPVCRNGKNTLDDEGPKESL